MSRPRVDAPLAVLLALAAALSTGCGKSQPAASTAAPESPKAPPMAGVDLTGTARLSDGVLSVSIGLMKDPAAVAVPITVSVDVYAAESPTHPERHYAFWNVDLAEPKRARELVWKIDTRTKQGTLSLDGTPADPQTGGLRVGEWRGPFAKGRVKGVLAAWPSNDPAHPRVFDLFSADAGDDGFSGFQASEVRGSF